jgi:hypothetical protein
MKTMRGPFAIVALVLAGAQPAFACAPVSPVAPALPAGLTEKDTAVFLAAYNQAREAHRPYAEAARVYDRQDQMWREAGSVVLLRIAAFNNRDPRLSPSEWRKQVTADPTVVGVTLEPVRWLKGQGPSTAFRVAPRGGGDCSIAAGWDVNSAKVGDTFVAYFTAGPLSDQTLLDGLAPEAVVEPTVRALLALHQ